MKKSLLALAVAGAVAVPYTAQATEVTVSGIADLYLGLSSSSQVGSNVSKAKSKDSDGLNVFGGDVRLNIGAKEDVGFAKAFGNVRYDVDGLDGTTVTSDAVKVGLMGDFGTVTLGSGPDVAEYGQKANDVLLGNPISLGQTLSYESPSFSGFAFGVNVIASSDRDDNGTFTNANPNATPPVVSTATSDEVDASGYAVGLKYAGDFGGVTVEAGVGMGTENLTYNGSVTQSNGDDKTKKLGTGTNTYNSYGVKVAFAPVWVALAQQGVYGETKNSTTGAKTKLEGKKSLDFQVGFDQGPFGASVTHSQGTGFRSILGSDQADGADDQKSTLTRLDAYYKLSSNVKVSTRFDTASDEVDTNNTSKSSSSAARVGMTVTF